jgi:hypothetical protein
MSIFEIPLSPASQQFLIALAGVQYQMSVTYRDSDLGGWFLDIADGGGNEIISGIPMVTGVDLLGQYAYLGIGGQLWVATDGNPTAPPSYESLGVSSHLYFVIP